MRADELATWVQSFFSDYLVRQRGLSPHTVAAYRDTFRLLLRFLQHRYRVQPAGAPLRALTASRLLAFLAHLEHHRHNQGRTRNTRLAAVRSFVHYALDALGPHLPAQTRQILAIPSKRHTHRLLGFLRREEMQALLDATDNTWTGRRDRLLFLLLYNTGARVSEITAVRVSDVSGPVGPQIQLQGKGRKQRSVPLWPATWRFIRQWIKANRLPPEAPLLPNRFGDRLTRFGVWTQLQHRVRQAQQHCPSLTRQRISPHLLRHTTAMHLLQAGTAAEVIALWLGHESPATTHLYVEADLAMKERALAKVQPPKTKSRPFQTADSLLRFLESLR